MPNFQNGKVYTIRSHQTEEFYIGSTCQKLADRFGNHKAEFKRYQNGNKKYVTSFKMLEYDDARMELLENCPCNDKNELTRREGELIRANPNCVNKVIPGRTKKQYRQDNAEVIKDYQKQWRQDNAEAIKQYQKQHYQDNTEAIKTRVNQYREDNADVIKARKKQYYRDNTEAIKARTKQYLEDNADIIKARAKQYREDNAVKIKQKHNCPCGGKYTTIHKARHLKTKKHKNYLEMV